MKTTILGGGNIGTLMAAEFAKKGHDVTVYTSKPEKWSNEIEVYDASDRLLKSGVIKKTTDSIEEALDGAEYIWVVMPAQLFSSLAKKMTPYLKAGQYIGVVPGSGGAEFAFHDAIKKGCTLFGFQRVHSIARLKKYGHAVYELGRKDELQIGAIPSDKTVEICGKVSAMFDMPCVPLSNYLSVTLTPSNPILHTTRLYSIFKDHTEGKVYPRNFLFYEEWDDPSSEMLIACDGELQKLCDVIPLDLKSVKSLRDHYESHTVDAMTKKISSIKAFKGLKSPMTETENGWVPDWNSRYFTADFSFGLKIIRDIAKMFGVDTPNIEKVWEWYLNAAKVNKDSYFENKLDKDSFLKLYGV